MLKRFFIFVMLLSVGVVLAACDAETGDTAADAEAAQAFLPTLEGFTAYQTANIQDAIATALGGAAAVSGNPGFVAVERIDSLIDCYRDVGAVEARIYIEETARSNTSIIPLSGVVAVINQDRLRSNFLACVTENPLEGIFGAQAVEINPCTGSGSFTAENGDTISYLYAATNTPLCSQFERHFLRYQS